MGGPSDIAYKNAMDDFSRVNHVPIVMTNFDVGHAGTYARPHGGEFTPVALAWLDWQLKGKNREIQSVSRGREQTRERPRLDRRDEELPSVNGVVGMCQQRGLFALPEASPWVHAG